MQQLSHGFESFLAFGCVAWTCRGHHVVLADAWVVDLLDHNAGFVHDFLDWLLLLGVDLDHLSLAIFTDDSGDALCVVDLGDQVNQLTGNVAHSAGQVVTIVVSANVAFFLTRKDRFTRTLVGTHTQRCVVLAGGGLDVLSSTRFSLQQTARSHGRLGALWQWQDAT